MNICRQFSEFLQAFFTDRLMHQQQASPPPSRATATPFDCSWSFRNNKLESHLTSSQWKLWIPRPLGRF